MPTPQITELIDKQDNFEIIRDQIAAILAVESANQVALATSAGKPDPTLWDLDVYIERFRPWEKWPNQSTNKVPIVNVWFDNSNFDKSQGNVVERQKSLSIFNIDIYGFGVAQADGSGQLTGDEDAARTAQRALRYCRNILMSSMWTYLGLARGDSGLNENIVWRRWPQSITTFQPEQDNVTVQNIVGIRLALEVEFNEFSPQYVPEVLEYLSAKVERAEDGKLLLEADFDYTAP